VLEAYRRAGIDPADIQLIEGEGTGTAARDLAELTTFAQLRRGGRTSAALGAVAAGIGYARAAAGIASLVKAALAMTAGTIPPGTGCARQHPLIESGEALLWLPRQPEPWPDRNAAGSGTRLAAVNSLGTADPAVGSDLYGPRGAEGVHLVLSREAAGDHGRGRRRRTDGAVPAPTAAAATVPIAAAAPVTLGTAVTSGVAPAGTGPLARAAPPAHVASGAPRVPRTSAALGGPLRGGSAEHPSVFALCGKDPGELAGRLEVIAEGAAALSAADLHGLARQLALDVLWADDRAGPGHGGGEDAGSGNGGSGNGGSGNGGSGNGRSEHGRSRHGRSGHAGAVRVALTAATAAQLAARARSAARLLAADVLPTAADPDVHVSTGAAGRVVVLFGGLARPGLSQAAQLVASLAGLRTLDWMGVTPGAAVGYSLGEITGLVWAGCLPAAEAARLVAQCGQVLRGCASGPAAMARVAADAETTRSLGAADRLHIAAYEGTRSHVLAGSTTGPPSRGAAACRRCRPAGQFHAQHLVQLDVVAVEAEPRARHVQPPHPAVPWPTSCDRLVPVRVQVGAPGGQGLGVVLAQVLLVPDLEAGVVHERDQVAGSLELAVGEHVPVDEPALADGGLGVVRPGDAVVQQPPADVQLAEQEREVGRGGSACRCAR
jgi:hypothetical protein